MARKYSIEEMIEVIDRVVNLRADAANFGIAYNNWKLYEGTSPEPLTDNLIGFAKKFDTSLNEYREVVPENIRRLYERESPNRPESIGRYIEDWEGVLKKLIDDKIITS